MRGKLDPPVHLYAYRGRWLFFCICHCCISVTRIYAGKEGRKEHQYFIIKGAQSCAKFHNFVQARATPRNSNLQKVAASCQFLGNGISGCYKQHSEGLGMIWKSLITNFRTNWRHPAGHPSWPMWSEFESKIARNSR